MKHLQYFSICKHGQRLSSDVEVTLVELSEPSTLVIWLIPSVNFSDLEPLDLVYSMCCHKPRKWNSQVISETEHFSSLICQIIHESLVVSVLLHEHLSPLKYGRVNLLATVSLENLAYLLKCTLLDCHLRG